MNPPMWQCPKCGEEIEDTFDACWKCAPTERPVDGPTRETPKRRRGLFLIYWERGWMVMLMHFCLGGILVGAGAVILVLENISQGLATLVALASLCGWLPVAAYWVFVVWLGKDAWRLPTATRSRSLLLTYWKRGWLIMLMNVCFGILLSLGGVVVSELESVRQALGAMASLAFLVGLLPAAAYWLFVLFFGTEAWLLPRADSEVSCEEKPFALLQEASRLEARGKVREAIEKYQQVVERFPGTEASHDAQISLESLRTKAR